MIKVVGYAQKKSYLCIVVRRAKRKPLPELLTWIFNF